MDGSGFYLPFDRVFTVQGFGTVATGTLRAGQMRTDDTGVIVPDGGQARVRGMEVHGQSVDTAQPGQRVAVNIRADNSLERGQALASDGLLQPAEYWDARLRLVDDGGRPFKNGTPVRVLHGTTETIATLRLLDRDRMGAGEEADVQFRLRVPDAAWDQDRFILRTISPVATVGGGQFLNTHARRRRRFDAGTMADLRAVAGDDTQEALLAHISQAGPDGTTLDDLSRRFSATDQDITGWITASGGAIGSGGEVFSAAIMDDVSELLVQAVGSFHDQQPSRRGLALPELVNSAGVPATVAGVAMDRLVERGQLAIDHGLISLPGFDPLAALGDARRPYLDRLETRLRDAAMKPPSMDEIVGENPQDRDLAELLIEVGRVLPLYDFKRTNLFLFHRAAVDQAIDALYAAFPPPTEFRAGEAREVLDSTRKYMIPFLTWLDRQHVTVRVDDFRQMSKIKNDKA